MRSLIPVCAFLSLVAADQAPAASLKKPYFAATSPGTWAKYESAWKMPEGTVGTNKYTYTRAPDDADRVRFEIDTEVVSGPGEGMTSRQLNVMEPGFDMAMNFLNHMKFLEGSVAQTKDGEPNVTAQNVIEIMRRAGGDFSNSVTFKGQVAMQGRKCDHYGYSYSSGGPRVTRHEGEIWLDEAVPFGIVFQKETILDASGEPISTFEQRLLDSGAGRTAAAVLLAMTPERRMAAREDITAKAPQTVSLLDAYQNEMISLLVEVKEGSGGKRLSVTVFNRAGDPLDVVVPGGPLTIAAGSPMEAISIVIETEERLSLPSSGASCSFSATQSGERGATEGKFNLTVHEGSPLFSGSVTIGPLE